MHSKIFCDKIFKLYWLLTGFGSALTTLLLQYRSQEDVRDWRNWVSVSHLYSPALIKENAMCKYFGCISLCEKHLKVSTFLKVFQIHLFLPSLAALKLNVKWRIFFPHRTDPGKPSRKNMKQENTISQEKYQVC